MVARLRLNQCSLLGPLSLLALTSQLHIGAVSAQMVDTAILKIDEESATGGDGERDFHNFVNSHPLKSYTKLQSEISATPQKAEEAEGEAVSSQPVGGDDAGTPEALVRRHGNAGEADAVEEENLLPTITIGQENSSPASPAAPSFLLTQLPPLPATPPSEIPPFQPEIPPQPPSRTPIEPPAPELLPPPEELLQSPPPTPITPEPVPGKVPESITVDRFEFEGNTAFSDEELAKVTERFTKRPISFAELFQARSAVTQLYIEQGYITSGALIPPQTLEGGVVKIQVVEGGLEAINVSGTRRLNPNYVRSRIAVATSKPLNQKRLLEALQLLQLNPLIQNLSAELAAGTQPGLSLLEVRVTEAKTFNTQLVLDNNRSPSIGTFQRQVQLTEANLLGLGDGLSVGYNNTEGSNGVDIGYTLPINPRNGTLSFNYGITSSDVIEPPFDRIDIEANSRYYELTLRQPLLQTPTQEFALGLTATRQESKTTLLDIPIALSPGADEQGRTRISALRFFQEWTKRTSREVLAARSQFSLGIGLLNATINDEPPDSRFFSWRGQVQWVRLLAADTLLLLRGDVQLADRALVPLEQIGLGGQDTIRGYRQDVLLTDNGALASAELRVPVLRLPKLNTLVQLAPFIDVGTAWNQSGRPDPDPSVLASIGLGLRLQVSRRLTVRLDYGIPLVSVSSSKRTWQENGFYFSIVGNPF
jgi:hemolysin activation/secretion protein